MQKYGDETWEEIHLIKHTGVLDIQLPVNFLDDVFVDRRGGVKSTPPLSLSCCRRLQPLWVNRPTFAPVYSDIPGCLLPYSPTLTHTPPSLLDVQQTVKPGPELSVTDFSIRLPVHQGEEFLLWCGLVAVITNGV